MFETKIKLDSKPEETFINQLNLTQKIEETELFPEEVPDTENKEDSNYKTIAAIKPKEKKLDEVKTDISLRKKKTETTSLKAMKKSKKPEKSQADFETRQGIDFVNEKTERREIALFEGEVVENVPQEILPVKETAKISFVTHKPLCISSVTTDGKEHCTPDAMVELKEAKQSISQQEALIISMTELQTKEVSLIQKSEIPQKADIEILTKNYVLITETESTDLEDELKTLPLVKQLAKQLVLPAKPVVVEEVSVQGTVSKLRPTEVVKHQGVSSIQTHQPICVEETHSELKELRLSPERYETKQVVTDIKPLRYVEISEVYSENVSEELKPSEPVSKNATAEIAMQEAIIVEEANTSGIGEDISIEKPKQSKALERMILGQEISITEVQSEIKEDTLKVNVIPKAINATENVTEDLSIEVSDAVVLGATKDLHDVIPLSNTAEIAFEARENICVIETTPAQREDILETYHSMTQILPNFSVTPTHTVEVSEIHTHDRESDYTAAILTGHNIKPQLTKCEALNVSEIIISDQESSLLLPEVKPEKFLQTSLPLHEAVIISENRCESPEDKLDVAQAAKVSHASPAYNSHFAVSVTETETNEAGDFLRKDNIIQENVKSSFVPEEALTVVEISSELKEGSIEKEIIPNSKNLTSSFVPEKALEIVVSDAFDRESILEETKKTTFQAQEILEVTEAVQVHSNDFKKEEKLGIIDEALKSFAIPEYTPHLAISVAETGTEVNEQLLISDTQSFEKATATEDVSSQKSALEVLETYTVDQEGSWSKDWKPEGRHAKYDLQTEEACTVSVMETNVAEESLELETTPASNKPRFEVVTQQAVFVSETESHVKEGDFQQKIMPNLIKAAGGIVEDIAVEIIENELVSKEEEYTPLPMPHGRKLTVRIESKPEKVVSISETQLNVMEGILKPVEWTTDKVTVSFEEKEAIAVKEVLDSGLIGELSETQAELKNAELQISPKEALQISETSTRDKETELEIESKPTLHNANLNVTPETAISVTEVESAVKEDNLAEIPRPSYKKAQTVLPCDEALTVEEVGIELSEMLLKEKTNPALSHADFTVTEEKALEVMDVQPNYSFGEMPVSLPDTKNASKLFEIEESLIVHEVTLAGNTDECDLSLQRPKSKSAVLSFEQQETVSIVEVESDIKESKLNDFVLPTQNQILPSLSVMESLEISAVETTEKELNLKSIPIPTGDQAEISIPESIAFSICSVQTNDTTDDIGPIPQYNSVEGNISIICNQPVGISEVQSLTNEMALEVEVLKQPVLAQPTYSIPHIPLTVINTLTKSATVELPQYNPQTQIAQSHMPLDEPVHISETTSIENADVTYTSDSIPQSEASFSIVPQQTYDVSTHEVLLSENKFTPETETLKTLSTSLVPHETVQISISKSVIRESEFQPETAPNFQVAERTLSAFDHIVVGETMSHQTSTPYNQDSMPELKEADSSFVCINQLPIVHELTSGTCESDLLLEQTPLSHIADVNIMPELSIEVSLTQSETTESDLREDEPVVTRTALTSISSAEALVIKEIIPPSQLGVCDIDQPIECSAEVGVTDLVYTFVSEVQTGEKESELELPVQPVAHKPHLNITSQEASITSVVEISDIEEVLEKSVIPLTQNLKPSFSTLQSTVTVEEITVSGKEGNLTLNFQPLIVASETYQPHEVVSVSEVMSECKEGILKDNIKAVETVAEVLFQGKHSIQISDTLVSEHEVPLKEIMLPNTQTAEEQFSSQYAISVKESTINEYISPAIVPDTSCLETVAAIQVMSNYPVSVSETASELHEVTLEEEAALSKKATVSILENVTASIEHVSVCDTSSDLKPDILPSLHNADTTLTPHQSIIVQQTQWDQKEDVFEREEFQLHGAKTDISVMRALEILECTAETKEQNLSEEIMPETHKADIAIPAEEALSIVEVNTSDMTRKLSLQDSPKKDVANLEMSLHETVLIEQQNEAEKENDLKIKSLPDTKTAVSVFPTAKHLHVSEVTVATAHGKFLPSETPVGTTADVLLTTQQSIVVSETTVDSKEDVLIHPVVPKTHAIQPEFNAIEPVYVSVTESEAKESEMILDQKPTKSRASVNISSADSVVISEVQSNLKEGPFVPQDLAVGIVAPFTLTTQEHISISEVDVASIETDLDLKELPKMAKAGLSFSSKSHITVSEIETELKEETLPRAKSPNQTTASVILPQEEHILVTQIDYDMKVGTFVPGKKPTDTFANVQIPTEQHLVISDIVSEVKEGMLKITKTPDFESAICSLPTEKHVNVSGVITSHKEGELEQIKKPEAVTAPFSILTKDHVTISLTESSVREGELIQEKLPQTTNASFTIPTKQHVFVSETSSGEVEEALSLQKFPPAFKADFSVRTEEHVLVSEILAPISEDTFTPDKKPIEFSAEQNLVSGEHIIVSEIETASKEATLESLKKPKADTADLMIDTEEHLLVSVVQSNVGEEEYVSERKPQEQTVKVSIPAEEHLTVLEITSNILEQELQEMVKPSTVKADFSVLTKEHVSMSTVETSLKEDTLKEHKLPEAVTAKATIPSESHVIISSTDTEDKEGEFNPSKLPVEVQLDFSLTTVEHVTVGEIQSQASEEEFISQKGPEQAMADFSVLKEDHVTISEVLPDVKEGAVSEFKTPAGVSLESTMNTEEHLIVGKVEVQTKEQEFIPLKLPSSSTAELSVLGQEHLEISEVPIQIKESEFIPDKLAETALAKVTIPSQEHISVSDVVETSESDELLIKPAPILAEANVSVRSQDHVIISEMLVAQKEGEAISLKKPQELQADVTFPSSEHVIISKVVPDNREGILDKDKSPVQEIADFSVPSMQHVIVSEVDAQTIEEEFKLESKPLTLKADFTIPTLDHVVVSEAESNIKETEMRGFEQPKESKVDITMSSKEHIQISEIETDMKESILVPDKMPTTAQASFTLPVDEHVVISETSTHQKEETLRVSRRPSETSADFTISSESHVLVSQVETVSKEEELVIKDIPKEVVADVTIPAEEYIVVSETQSQTNEEKLKPDKSPITVTADYTVPTEEYLEVSEVKTELKTEEVTVEKIPRGIKADVTVPTTQHIIVSETESNLQAKEFSTTLPVPNKAKQTLAVKEPIRIDEIPGEVSIEQQVTLTQKKKKVERNDAKLDFIDTVYEEAAEFKIQKPEEENIELLEEVHSFDKTEEKITKPKEKVQKMTMEDFSPFTVILPEDENITEENTETSVTKKRTVKVVHKKMKDGKVVAVKEIVETFASGTLEKSRPTIEDVTETDAEVLESESSKQPIIEEFEEPASSIPDVSDQPEELHAVVQEETTDDEKDETSITFKKKPKSKKEIKPDIKDESETDETVIKLKKKSFVEEIETIPAPTEEFDSDDKEQIISIPHVEKMVDDVEILIEGAEDIIPTAEAKIRREGPEVFISETKETKTEFKPIPDRQSPAKKETIEETKITMKKKKSKPVDENQSIVLKDETVSETITHKRLSLEHIETKTYDTSFNKTENIINTQQGVTITEKLTETSMQLPKVSDRKPQTASVTDEEIIPVEVLKEEEQSPIDVVEHSILKLKKKTKEKTTDTIPEKILSVEEEKPVEATEKAIIKLKKKPKEDEKPTDVSTERKPSLKEEEEVIETVVKRKPSIKEEKPAETTEKTILKLKKKPKEEEKPAEISIERKSSVEDKPEETVEQSVVKLKKKPKDEEKPIEATVERKPSVEEEQPKETTEKAVLKLKKKPKEDEKPTEISLERKPSFKEEEKIIETVVKRKPSIKEEKPEETIEKTVLKLKKKPKEEEKPTEVSIERKPSVKDKPQETVEQSVVKLKKKPEDEEKPIEVTVERKPSVEEEQPKETTEKAVLKLKKKPKDEEKPTEVSIERKPSLKEEEKIIETVVKRKPSIKEEKPEETTEKTTLKLKKKPKEEEKSIEISIERKPSLKEEDKPEDVTEQTFVKLKKKSKEKSPEVIEKAVEPVIIKETEEVTEEVTVLSVEEEKKPEEIESTVMKIKKKPKKPVEADEVVIERKPSLTEEKPEETVEKAVIKLKKKPADEKTAEVAVERKLSLQEENVIEEATEHSVVKLKKKPKEEKPEESVEKAVLKLKKKPKEEEKPEITVERKLSLKEDKPVDVVEHSVVKLKKKPKDEETTVEAVVERKLSLKEERKEEISEKAVLKLKKKPKEEEKPEEVTFERKPSLIEEVKSEEVTKHAVLKIKKKPKIEEEKVEMVAAQTVLIKEEEKTVENVEHVSLTVKKKEPKPEAPETELKAKRKPSIKQGKQEELETEDVPQFSTEPFETDEAREIPVESVVKEVSSMSETKILKSEEKTEKITLKKKKTVIKEEATPMEEFKIPLKSDKIEESPVEETEFSVVIASKPEKEETFEEAEIVLPKPEETKYTIENQTVDLTIKKIIEVEEPEKFTPEISEIPATEEKVKLKRKPKKQEEPVSEEITITKKSEEKTEDIQEVTEVVKIDLDKKPESVEVPTETTFKLSTTSIEESKLQIMEEAVEITVKKIEEITPEEKKPEKVQPEEKKPEKVQPEEKKPDEPIEEKVKLKRKPKVKEAVAEEIELPKPAETKPEEVVDVQEEFKVYFPTKLEKKEEIVEETSLKLTTQEALEEKFVVQEETAEITVKKKVETPIVKEEIETTVVKKRVKKPEPVKEDVVEFKIPQEKETVPDVIESVEESFAIKMKPKEKVKPEAPEETAELVVLEEEKPKPYVVSEEEAEVTVKKKVEVEEITEKRILKKKTPKLKDTSEAEFKITLDEKKPEEEEMPKDVEEQFTIKTPKKDAAPVVQEVEEVLKIKPQVEKEKYVVTEEAAEVTVKKEVIKEDVGEVKMSLKKKQPKKTDDQPSVFKIPLEETKPDETLPEDTEERFAVTIPKKKPTKESETVADVITIKPTEPVKEEVENVEITVKKEVIVEEKPETAVIKKKSKLKPKREKSESRTEESFAIPLPTEKEPSPQDVSVEEKVTVGVRKIQKQVQEAEESFKLTVEKKEVTEYKTEEVSADLTVKKEVHEEELTKVEHPKKEEVEVTKKLKLKKKPEVKPKDEPVEQTFAIPFKEEKPEEPEEQSPVEEKFSVKLKEKEKPAESKTAEESFKLVVQEEKPAFIEEVAADEATVVLQPKEDKPKTTTKEEDVKTVLKLKPKKRETKEDKKPEAVKETFEVPLSKTVEEQPVEEAFAVSIPKKKKPIEEETEDAKIVIPVEKKGYKVTEESEEVTVRKVVEEKEEKVSIKKRKEERKKQEVFSEVFSVSKKPEKVEDEEEQAEFKIDLPKKPQPKFKESPEEEDSFKLTLPAEERKPEVIEESAEITVRKKATVKDEKEVTNVEERISIKKPKKKTETVEQTMKESFTVHRKDSVQETKTIQREDVEESFSIKAAPKKKPQISSDEEESFSLSVPSEKPEYKIEDVSDETKVTLEQPSEKEIEIIEEILETTEYVAISSFVSDKPDTITLVEGERVQVIEKTHQDWWFVRKVVTNERGYVSPDVLEDSVKYTHYMKDTLSKKMEKLPVLRLPKPGEKLTAPKIVKKLTPLKVVDGQTAELSCQVSGNPRPTITWFKQTQIIKPSMEFQIFYDDDNVTTLIIREVFPEDAGTYTVVAKNAAGFTSCSADLIVEAPLSDHGTDTYPSSRLSLSRQSSLTDILEGIPPVFSEKPKDKDVDEGKPIELICKVTGIPEPKITWLRNQKPLKESDRIQITSISEDLEVTKGTVIIKKAKPEDAGTYEIIAENREGKSVTSLILNVSGKPQKPKDEPPLFTQTFSDLTCTENETVTLTVKVQGTPPPDVTWFKNGKEIKPSKNVKPSVNQNVYTLVLSETKKTDTAEYKCIAKNPKGTTEHTAKLTVQKTGVTFVEKLYDAEVKERESAVFVIEVSHPDAQVTWHKDGEKVKPTDRVKFVEDGSTRKLIIEETTVLDEGEYTCVLGENESTAELVVIELPPDFKGEMKDVTVATEQVATFQVELTKGDARARWFKDDKEIDYSEHVMLKIDGKKQKLIIYNANFEDVGTYTCVVGSKKRCAKLKVEAPTVEFTARLPEKMTVPQDTDVSFTVELSRPDVPVQWLKNGQPVPEKEKDKFQFIKDRNVYKLIVQRAQKDDAAEYSCVAGNVKTTTKLQVQEAHAEFTLKLRDVVIRESNTATLLVEVTRETFEVRWMKDGQTLKPTERFIMEKEGCRRRLIIKDTSLDDRGLYTCVLDEKTCSSTLTVEATPRVNSEKRHFKGKRGGNVTVDVEFTALPPPKIEWFYKGKTISLDKKRTIENYGNKTVLTIKKLEDADVENYTLKLTNKCGECKTDFTVSIIDKPKSPGMPTASEITSDSLTLSWKVPESDGGSPITNYIIEFHDRNTLRWSTYNEKFTIEKPFTKVEKLKEGEEYMFRVIAVNEVGKSDPSPGTKYVPIQELKAGEPPAVMEHLQPVTCGLKKPAKMTCRISGQPPPTIKWLKNGKELLVMKNIKTTYENQVATMEISETTEKSAGTYTCKATNNLGSVESTNELKIQEPPSIKYDEKLKSVRLKSYSEYLLDVKVFGYPAPEIVWLKNGKVLESTKHTLVQIREDSTTITIRSVENTDSATYTLQLTNPAATVKHDFRLFVLDKPLPPEGPIAFHKIEKNSVTIGWLPPSIGESEVMSYIIEKCEVRRKIWMEVTTVNSTILTQDIQDLSEGIEYAFRVIASNEYGRSDPLTSDPVAPKSLFDKPYAPKGPFTTSNMTESSFTLSWLAPDNDGGSPIIEYIVERKEASRKAWQRVGTTDGKSLSMEVTGLKKEMAYHFRVCCRNDIGHSPYFAPEETITAGLRISPPSSPVGPLNVSNMTNKTLTLSWKPPENTGGAELTAYIVEKRESTKKAWNRLETLQPHIRSYTVHNLTHKKEYFFRVFAENPAGLSPPLETDRAIKLTSTAERPSPPTGPLEKVVTGPSSVILAWGRPEKDGGSPILGYTVALRNVRRIMWMEVGQTDGETQRIQIKDLQEGSEYMIRIMARNEVGISDPLEPEEPVKVIRPAGFKESDMPDIDDKTISVSYSTETSSSWIREANVEPLLRSYTKHILAGRNEYFFRIWHLAETLSK